MTATASPDRIPALLPGLLLAILLLLARPALPAPLPDPEAGGSDDVDPEPDYLEMLWSGTEEERLEAAADFSLWDPNVVSAAGEAEARNRVRRVLDAETDPWIRFLALSDLAEYGDDWAGLLFVDLLQEGRAVDLWPALVWLSEADEGPEALEALRRLWPARDRPWLRPRLVEALALHGAVEMRPELEALAREIGPRDLELARAALGAVIHLGDPLSIPFLIEIARAGEPFGATAVSGLGEWPEHFLAGPALVELASHRLDSVRRAALQQLAKVPGEESLQARLRRAGDDFEESSIRQAALDSLEEETDPLVLDLVTRILLDGGSEPHPLERSARRLLWSLSYNDDAAWRLHQSLYPPEPPARVTTFCGGILVLEQPSGPGLRVTPSDSPSARCWAAPGRPHPFRGNPVLADGYVPRLLAGATVRIDAVFEAGSELWARVAVEECWVPMDLLVWREPDPAEADLPWGWQLSAESSLLEYDIPLHEADTGMLDALVEAGLVTLIDPGPGVIGASLDPGVASPRHRDLLRRLAEAGDAPLFTEGLQVALSELSDLEGMDTPPEE